MAAPLQQNGVSQVGVEDHTPELPDTRAQVNAELVALVLTAIALSNCAIPGSW